MPQLSDYDIYIFDCDGVILDSNQLKIEAMRNALAVHFSNHDLINDCISYFRNNFGKSRFHHVGHFLDSILDVEKRQRHALEQLILTSFSTQCRALYLKAEITPGFIAFLRQCKGKRYVASGSEQNELRNVFVQRGLNIHFDGVFGSPTSKAELIRCILKQENNTNAVMFGDAESDMSSAKKNQIDFVFYAPYSNVKEKMIEQCQLQDHLIIDDFSTMRF